MSVIFSIIDQSGGLCRICLPKVPEAQLLAAGYWLKNSSQRDKKAYR